MANVIIYTGIEYKWMLKSLGEILLKNWIFIKSHGIIPRLLTTKAEK